MPRGTITSYQVLVEQAASDLDAFRKVLRGGRAGELFETGDPAALAEAAYLSSVDLMPMTNRGPSHSSMS